MTSSLCLFISGRYAIRKNSGGTSRRCVVRSRRIGTRAGGSNSLKCSARRGHLNRSLMAAIIATNSKKWSVRTSSFCATIQFGIRVCGAFFIPRLQPNTGRERGRQCRRDDILTHAPKSGSAYSIRKQRWERENPPPTHSSPPNPEEGQLFTAADQEYGIRYAAFSLALIQEYWGQPLAGFDASDLLASEHVPPDRAGALADFALSTAARFPDQSTSSPPRQIQIAEAYISARFTSSRSRH